MRWVLLSTLTVLVSRFRHGMGAAEYPNPLRVLSSTHPITQPFLGTDLGGSILFVSLLHNTHPTTRARTQEG
jgi:hypothetical protein